LPAKPGGALVVTAAIRDNVTRKTAGKYLPQIEGRYHTLLETSQDAMVVVNQEGKIVLHILREEKQFTYHRDELVGQKVTTTSNGCSRNYLRSAEEALAEQTGTGIKLLGRCKKGEELPIDVLLSPLEDAKQILVTATIGEIGVRRDAEMNLLQLEGFRRRVEEALRECEERYPIILNGVENRGGQTVALYVDAEEKAKRRERLVERAHEITAIDWVEPGAIAIFGAACRGKIGRCNWSDA
jgi:PAS domain S-box-containing protein